MTAKLAVEGLSSGEEKVRRAASTADILGRHFGTKNPQSEVPPELITRQKVDENKAREHLRSAIHVFGSLDSARQRIIDPELRRGYV